MKRKLYIFLYGKPKYYQETSSKQTRSPAAMECNLLFCPILNVGYGHLKYIFPPHLSLLERTTPPRDSTLYWCILYGTKLIPDPGVSIYLPLLCDHCLLGNILILLFATWMQNPPFISLATSFLHRALFQARNEKKNLGGFVVTSARGVVKVNISKKFFLGGEWAL